MLGVDSDNDSAFMSQSGIDYCRGHGLVQTRSRAYKSNDQAWVEQKNGAIVRRLVGYERLSGAAVTTVRAQLYSSSRRYINFFQPLFKLKAKTRDGARVHKAYFTPATPCERPLAQRSVGRATEQKLKARLLSLDPVRLLQEVRLVQKTLSDVAAHGVRAEAVEGAATIDDFVHRVSRRHGKTEKSCQRIRSGPRLSTGGQLGWIRLPMYGRWSRDGWLPNRQCRPRY